MNGKYFKYAIGEIFLVVIGILIALSINNWNEDRKSEKRRKLHVETLIADLLKDSTSLTIQNKYMQEDLDQIIDISNRLSVPTATISLAREIYNNETTGRFDPTNVSNKNTFNVIISTGDLNLFDHEFKNSLLNFYAFQERAHQVVDSNIELNLDLYKQLQLPPRENSGAKTDSGFGIKGHLLKQMQGQIDDSLFLNEFSKFINNKAVMEENIIIVRQQLIDQTVEFLNYLRSIRGE